MSQTIKPERVFNGTFSSVWVDDVELAQANALEAKWTIEKTEVNQTGTLAKGYKITGIDGKGTIKLNKIDSFFLVKVGEPLKEGKTVVAQILSKIADPDGAGVERVLLTGVTFDEVDLINWEAKKLLEESVPFTFTGYEILETIDHDAAMA